MGAFEPKLVGSFEGEATAEVLDPLGVEPQNIIKATVGFKVKVKMIFTGGLAYTTLNNAGNRWRVQAFVDNIGPPWHEEQQIGPDVTKTWSDMVLLGPDPTYTIEIDVPAGTLLPGIYKLGAVITSEVIGPPVTSAGVYGFTEGNLFMIAA